MNMLFIGMDLSITASGVVLLDRDLLIRSYHLVESTTGKPDIVRLPEIASKIKETIQFIIEKGFDPEDTYVLLENYSYGSNTSHLTRLGELGGQIKKDLLDFGIPWHHIWVCAPTTLKKYVTGKGQGAKSQVMLSAYKKWGADFGDDNLCDAYILARLMRHVIIEHEPIKYELECLKAVAKMNKELWENNDVPWFVYGRGDRSTRVKTKEDPSKTRITKKTNERKNRAKTKGKFRIPN